jgi:hypothetical protein
MILDIDNALERWTIFYSPRHLFNLSYNHYEIFSTVGITKKNIKNSILPGAGVGIIYGIIRDLFLKFFPGSSPILRADLVRITTTFGRVLWL